MSSIQPILILKTGEPPPDVKTACGDFEYWIGEGLGAAGVAEGSLVIAEVHLGEDLPDPAQLSGVVVTGSPAMVTDREDWSEASGRWLAEVVRADALPVLGICYGHQLLAHALGGRVAKNPKGRETGTFKMSVNQPPTDASARIFSPGAYWANFSHLESVVALPEGAVAFASTELEPHAAIRFGPRQWGVQFHPEFSAPIMRAYIDSRRSALLEEGFDPDALKAGVKEAPEASQPLARFGAFVVSERSGG